MADEEKTIPPIPAMTNVEQSWEQRDAEGKIVAEGTVFTSVPPKSSHEDMKKRDDASPWKRDWQPPKSE